MRSCDEFLDLISAALDNELSADESAALDEHLNQCCVCKALFDDLRQLHDAASNQEDIAAPTGFAQQVMSRIAADPAQETPMIPFPSKRKVYYPWKKWAVSAAAIAVVIFGAYSLPGFFSMGGSAPSAENGLAASYDAIADQSNASTAVKDSSDADYSTTEDAIIDKTADGQDADDVFVPDTDGSGSAPTYILNYSFEEQPDGLDEFPFTEDEEGNLTYTVPPDYFFSLSGFFDQSADTATYLIYIAHS